MRQLIAFMVGISVLVGGCGTDEKAARAKAKAAEARRQAAKDKATAKRQAQARVDTANTAARDCQQEMGGLLSDAKRLGSRLDVGLNYESYSNRVSDLKVSYDEIEFDKLGTDALTCLSGVGLPLEKAVNQYVSAYRTWNECFEDLDCDNDSITSTLQSKWSKAGRFVDRAERGLDGLVREVARAQSELERLD
jgi:hypothetical protein